MSRSFEVAQSSQGTPPVLSKPSKAIEASITAALLIIGALAILLPREYISADSSLTLQKMGTAIQVVGVVSAIGGLYGLRRMLIEEYGATSFNAFAIATVLVLAGGSTLGCSGVVQGHFTIYGCMSIAAVVLGLAHLVTWVSGGAKRSASLESLIS